MPIVALAGAVLGVAVFSRPILAGVDAVLGWLDDSFARLRTRAAKDAPIALLLLSPALLILGAFGVAPLFAAVYMSLFNLQHGVGPYVGLGNYAKALGSPAFWKSLLVTVYFAFGTVPFAMFMSFIVASLLFRIVRGRGVLRTFYFLPYVTSAVAAAMVWRFIFHPHVGLANEILSWVGIEPKQWLLEPRGLLFFLSGGRIPAGIGPSLALCCVIIFEVWHASGFMIVIFLAGLAAIPKELDEAARIDGANWFQTTRNVTLPILSPTVFFLAVVSVIKAFQSFNGFYALTGNGRGPLDTTQNMTVYIYANFYEYGRWGYGAAVATLLCVGIVGLTLLQWRLVGRRVHYE